MKNHGSGNRTYGSIRIVILVISVIVAVALGIGGILGLCLNQPSKQLAVDAGDAASEGAVGQSANSFDNVTDLTTGLFSDGDYIDYTYKKAVHTIKFPIGTFVLEVWGAMGGNSNDGVLGGYGGYSYCTYTTTAVTTVYLFVGGQGAKGNQSTDSSGNTTYGGGGYNGGGGCRGTKGYGRGGGGSTFFGFVNQGLGSYTTTQRDAGQVIIVAGGGGGTQSSKRGGDGGGGNLPGTAGASAVGDGGGAGTLTAGGAGGGSYKLNSNDETVAGGTKGSNGAAGKGGVCGNGTDGNAAGGGGGGWYGGGGGGGDYSEVDDAGGGGGSGYVNVSGTVPSGKGSISNPGGTTGANKLGHGRARITFGSTRGTTATFSNPDSETFTTTSTTADRYVSSGRTLSVNNTIEFTKVGQHSITLPRGYYKFELWGAEGGGARLDTAQTTISGNGGKGGYTQGVYAVSAASQELFFYVGGHGGIMGTTGTLTTGGDNGGGTGKGQGRGGGGATHIATATGKLSALSSNTSAVIAVAGGGGGAQMGHGGDGGGLSGSDCPTAHPTSTSSSLFGTPGKGGTQDGGGSGANAGSFGQGGNSAAGSDAKGGGAGGGGWYGGGGATSDSSNVDDYGGGGGSGYYGGLLSSSITLGGKTYSRSMQNGVRYNDGMIRITLININSAPTTASLGVTGKNLGDTYTLYSYNVAKDNDYHTITTSNTGVYFFNSLTDKANYTSAGLYLDSGCTTSASNYVTWTVNSNQQMTLTFNKKLPRTGVDNQTDNKLTLYVRVRDNFTTGNSSDSYYQMTNVVSFTVTFNAISPTKSTGSKTSGVYTYRYGTATTTSSSDAYGKVYSPTNTSTWALSVDQAIDLDSANKSFTVNVADLITNPNSTYYDIYIVPGNAGTGYSYSGTTTTIHDWTAANTYSDKTAYKSVTVTVSSSASTWYTANWSIFVVEKSSGKGSLYEPPSATAPTLQVNFRANKKPTQKTLDVTGQSLGGTYNLYSYNIAQDPDYTNVSATDGNVVYFASSTASLDTHTSASLYLDKACTKSVKDTYVSISMTNNQTMAITFKKLPREGTDSQANNKITLYALVRDGFGGSKNTYFYDVFVFTVSFNGLTITHGSNTTGVASNGYTYRYGAANTQDTDDIATGGLYASTANAFALNIQQVLKVNGQVTVPASSLLPSTYNSYYKAYIVPTALSSGTPFTYTGTTTTIYDHTSGSTYSSKTGYESITIKCTGNSLDWQNTTWTLYVVETASVGATYREPTSITYTGGQTISVTFRLGNIRPVLRSTQNNVIDINVGATGTYYLNTYFSDADGEITATTHTVEGIAVPTKEFVQLNKYGEIVSVAGASGASSGTSYYNVYGTVDNASLKTTGTSSANTGFDTRIASSTASSDAFVRYAFSNNTFTLTGLRASYYQYASTPRASTAYTGGKIGALDTSGAVQNPGHFYLLLHIRDKNDTSDDGIFLPIAVRVGNTDAASASPVTKNTSIANSGQSQMSTMPTASGSSGDTFYFAPMAINVGNNSNPIGQYMDGSLKSTGLQGLALDGDNFSTADGTPAWSNKLNEFLTITDISTRAIVNTMGSNCGATNTGTDSAENYYAKIEFVNIYVPTSKFGYDSEVDQFGGRIYVNENGTLPSGARNIELDEATDVAGYYITKGLKITLKSSTFDRYFYATVNVRDTSGHSKAIDIAIRVADTAPAAFAATDSDSDNTRVVEFKESRRARNGYSVEYSVTDMPTLSYKVKADSNIIVTPYDIFGDFDMSTEGIRDNDDGFKFTLNGLSGAMSGSTFTVGGSSGVAVNALFNNAANQYSSEYGKSAYVNSLTQMLGRIGTASAEVKPTVKYSASNTYAAATPGVTFNDRLFFARATEPTTDAFLYNPYNPATTNFKAQLQPSGGYVNQTYGNTLVINGSTYNIDFIIIRTDRRSTPQKCDYVYTVRDRAGNGKDFRISVEVVNTEPKVNNASAVRLAAKAVSGGTVINTDASVYVSSTTAVNSLMADRDNDVLSYITERGVVVANTPDLYNVLRTEYYANHTGPDDTFELTSLDDIPQKYLVDQFNNILSDCYVSAQMVSSDRLTVHAIGSTKNLPNGLFVYFFVTDGRGGETLGYKQVEVENTPLALNTDEGGFSTDTWTIESTSGDDYVRTRYITGSELAADKLKESASSDIDEAERGKGAISADIRVIASDIDKMSGVLLSQRDSSGGYKNLSGNDYESAVPSIVVATDFANIGASYAAVIVFTDNNGTRSAELPMTKVENGETEQHYFVDLLFFVEGIGWKTRAEVVAGLADGSLDEDDYFDSHGRWTVTEWALSLRSDLPFAAGVKLGVSFSLRDEAKYGGDTAGINSAYATDRNSANVAIAISARVEATVYQQIYGTGIRTIDEYAKFDNYYAVGAGGKNYVVENVSGSVSASTEYVVGDDYENAFKYPSAITAPETGDTLYVPMSYFGTLAAIATYNEDGTFNYDDDYVGYDVRTRATANASYSKNVLEDIASAIEVYDGTTRWSGATGSRALNNNPYITFGTFLGDKSDETFGEPFYNKLISIASDNRVVYLNNQMSRLKEHLFGLTISKKEVRTGARNLTLTVKLAKSKAASGEKTDVTDINFASNPEQDYRSVSVSVRVENSKLDLVSVDSDSQVSSSVNVLQYDTQKKTYYTDVSMPSASTKVFALLRDEGDSIENDIYSDGINKILYSDSDVGSGNNASYRDFAYFSLDSLNKLSSYSDSGLPYALNSDGTALANVADSEKARNSVLYFYGASSINSSVSPQYQPNGGIYGTNNSVYDEAEHTGAGNEGYSGYFNVSNSADGRILNITSIRKTFINEIALKKEITGALTQNNVKEAYAKRGLVAEYDDASVDPAMPSRVYYPLNVMIYDHRSLNSAGWADASYVAMEFRVQITNAAPELKNIGDEIKDSENNLIGRKYSFDLAVGGRVSFNLYDFVKDPDIFVDGSGSYRALATQASFGTQTGITLETGDFLESPYKNTRINTTNDDLIDGTGGLSAGGSLNDVIMWMVTPDATISANTEPESNYLSFSVNRRTTDSNGRDVSKFEFTVRFYDSYGDCTLPITFVVNVINQSPKIITDVSNIVMRAGDDFNILTTYYDNFVGGTAMIGQAAGGKDGSIAYRNSTTCAAYEALVNNPGNNASPLSEGGWNYSTVTKAYCDNKGFITDSSQMVEKNVHLGYVALVDDDTPWRLRISSYTTHEKLSIYAERELYPEGQDNDALPLSLRIVANGACQTDITVKVIDGEGGERTHTFRITVISSPPVARVASDITPMPDDMIYLTALGVEGVKDVYGNYIDATYRLFTTPYGNAEMNVNGFDNKKRASSEYNIVLSNLARDPDGNNETDNMTLHNNGLFEVNGVLLVRDSMERYVSDYFYIEITNNGKSFKLHATGYNPDSAYETLVFYIGDYGNDVPANRLRITLQVYTLYSDMTNPTVAAMSDSDYEAYLSGSAKVNVKARDVYDGVGNSDPDSVGVASTYAVIKLKESENSNGFIVGSDGNTQSPIVDPDVSVVGKQNYGIRLYAFMENENEPTSAAVLGTLLKRNKTARTFTFADRDRDSLLIGSYLIGGVDINGISIDAGDSDRLDIVQKYVDFSFSADGDTLLFTPKNATLGKTILLYVEVQKRMNTRGNTRSDDVLYAGSMFSLVVADSAPLAVDANVGEAYNHSFEGRVNESKTFKIFDPNDRPGSLFYDMDIDDFVTVAAFANVSSYEKALSDALASDPKLDWRANASEGKEQAFTLAVGKEPDTNISTLTVTVKRRIDKMGKDSNDNDIYLDKVSFPIKIVGKDLGGKEASTVIMLTVCNTQATAIADYSQYDSTSNVGYTFRRESDDEYIIDAQVIKGSDVTVNLSDFMRDDDIKPQSDLDSYAFVSSEVEHFPCKYLLDSTLTVMYYADQSYSQAIPIADIKPIFTDKWHYTGFKITAVSELRNYTASAYVRIVDRSTDRSVERNGVVVRINITVMNDRPFVKPDKSATTEVLLGSDTGIPESKTFFIGDYVGDNNDTDVTGAESENSDTYLRIESTSYLPVNNLYSTASAEGGASVGSNPDSSALFSLIIKSDNAYNQLFEIRPKQGFYGNGAVEITVADGDLFIHPDTLTVRFRINVQIAYNPSEIAELNGVNTARGKTTAISIDTLVPDIENTLSTATVGSSDGARRVTPRNAAPSFNPSSSYMLLSVEPQVSEDPVLDASSYVSITHEEGSSIWSLRALKVTAEPKQINVRYALKSDPSRVYENSFHLSVAENRKPDLLYNEITFVRYSETEDSNLFMLDTNDTAYLRPDKIWIDPEDDIMTYVSVKSRKPSLVAVSITDNGLLAIKFNARGSAEITVTVSDETDESVTRTFVAINNDLPAPSFWMSIVSNFEANKVIWAIVLGCVLLLVVILIIVIAVVKKRKHAREELEALLVSEMEIEEQMLKLAGGPSPTGYQSYGYLQSAPGQPVDPNLLLGTGTSTPSMPIPELAPPSDGAEQVGIQDENSDTNTEA